MSLTAFAGPDYASQATDRRSISGIAVMLGGGAVCAISRTQYDVMFSTTEAEYVTMIREVTEGLFVRSVLTFMQLGVVSPIELSEDNKGGHRSGRELPEFQ